MCARVVTEKRKAGPAACKAGPAWHLGECVPALSQKTKEKHEDEAEGDDDDDHAWPDVSVCVRR